MFGIMLHINGFLHILLESMKKLYTFCLSHRLCLVVAPSCSIQCVINILDQIKDFSFFYIFSEPRVKKMHDLSIENHAHRFRRF